MSPLDLNRFYHEFHIGPKFYKVYLDGYGSPVRLEESNSRVQFPVATWLCQTLEAICKVENNVGFKKKFNGSGMK